MAVVGHASENRFLEDSAFTSQAKGQNEIARSAGGRTRVGYELLTGTNPFPDEQPATLKNPQRRLGHDHCGPPWGSAFLHPVVWWSWEKASAANVIRPLNAGGNEIYEEAIQAGVTAQKFGPMVFWNRPHAPLHAAFGAPPYSNLVLYIAAHKKAANAALDIRLIVGADDDTFLDSVTITSATVTGYVVDSTTQIASGLLPLLHMPTTGGRNKFTLEFSSTALAADALTIDAWALCQVRKRRWLNP